MKSSCNVLHSLSASEPKTVKRRPQKNFQTRKKGITLEHQGKTKHLRKYLVLPGVVSFFPLGTGRFFYSMLLSQKPLRRQPQIYPAMPCAACINVLGQKVRQGVQPSFPLPLGTTFIHGIRERRELRWLVRSGHPSTRCTASGADWIVLPR